ncbi:hypothetical protein CRM22_003870 [Opisthorchis felineus]|uniref:Secreted protein n=1 Tax=Opisthorchis felineus TaxID=147828 RepID=A0A4S2M589_OPIFE|nr:hypothetical protein CRM22_003870 [Opisthorchis felineus]
MSRLTAICLQLFVIYHFYDAIDSKPTPKPVDYVKCFNRCEPKSGKPLEMLTNKGCVASNARTEIHGRSNITLNCTVLFGEGKLQVMPAQTTL